MNLTPRQRALLQKMNPATEPNPIRRLAMYRALIEESHARGKQPNPEWVSRAQQIELFGQSRFTPQELHRANLMAEHLKHEFRNEVMRQERAQVDEEARESVEKSVREMTHGMLGQPHGINQAQLRAIREGKDIPRAERPRRSQEALDAQWRNMTKRLDPKGKGWGEKEAVRRMDELADAKPEQLARLAGQYRSGVNLKQEAAKWDEQRVAYGVMRKRVERDIQFGRRAPETTEPTGRDSRRAAIVDAYMQTTADQIDRDSRRGLTSEASNDFEEVPYQLNEEHDGKPTRRAQIAQALQDSEAEGSGDDGY